MVRASQHAGDTTPLAIRMPRLMVERLDAHAARMSQIHKGLTFSRADAVKSLLEEALEKYEAPESKKRR